MSKLYLTDEQYLELLEKMMLTLSTPGFKPEYYDSTTPGDKYTESNCDLCNDNFTTATTALFPDDFPGRKDMKYRKDTHVCPFDNREFGKAPPSSNGCFYTCHLFRDKKHNIDSMKARTFICILKAKIRMGKEVYIDG